MNKLNLTGLKYDKKLVSDIAEKIKGADKIALFHHISPDGDTMTCSYSFAKALKSLFPNKEVKVVCKCEDVQKRFGFFSFEKEYFINEIDSSWLAIVGDVSVKERIVNYNEFLKAGSHICFDHHDVEKNINVDLFWKEKDWVASTMQAIIILDELKIQYDEEHAVLMLIGLLTDSGFFSYSAAEIAPLQIFKYLIQFISKARMIKLYNSMFISNKLDIKLNAFVWSNVKYFEDVAYIQIKKEDFEKMGVKDSNAAKKFTNKIGNIEGTTKWLMFFEEIKELPENQTLIYVSLRSLDVDLVPTANKFNGGGHAHASGAKVTSWEEADKLIKAVAAIKGGK
ncbi:MAG: hypothetical protein GY679_04555 [Mycoplasma sp.]|nr:hypothetical protein [Mycoplasma sp.]